MRHVRLRKTCINLHNCHVSETRDTKAKLVKIHIHIHSFRCKVGGNPTKTVFKNKQQYFDELQGKQKWTRSSGRLIIGPSFQQFVEFSLVHRMQLLFTMEKSSHESWKTVAFAFLLLTVVPVEPQKECLLH